MRDFLKVTGKRIVAALIAAVIYDLVSRQLYSETPPLAFLGEPITRFLLIFAVAFVLMSLVIRYLKKQREKLVSDNAPSVYVAKGKPRHIDEAVSLEKWGVEWRGFYGRKSRRSEPYVHVEGPFCPHDDTELTRRKVSKWVFFTRRVWVCPACDREYKRPRRHLYNESDEVGKIMESAIRNDRVADTDSV
jgi:hypothetical protein